jgi:hypothetical protein
VGKEKWLCFDGDKNDPWPLARMFAGSLVVLDRAQLFQVFNVHFSPTV